MAEIIIAGSGVGGLAAAIKLAAAGYNVTVYEKNKRADCGFCQEDSFDSAALDFAGLPMPEEYKYSNNRLTINFYDDDAPKITLPPARSKTMILVERKKFWNFLVDEAIKAGVNFMFGCEVIKPVIVGSRVVGVKLNSGNVVFGDLIIDAAGVDSPLRRNLPDKFHIRREIDKYDYLYTYRIIFEKKQNMPETEEFYNIFLKDNGAVGFTWSINNEDNIDVLIVRFNKMNETEHELAIEKIKRNNPLIGNGIIGEEMFSKIPIRQPLALMVADGYAAVGDSAYMTQAHKGSGIEYSVKAGAMLADAVLQDTEELFTCETLWDYEKNFFKEIGFGACRLAVAVNLLPYLTTQELSAVVKEGVILPDDLDLLTSLSTSPMSVKKLVSILHERAKLLSDFPEFRAKLLGLAKWIGRFTITEPSFPSKYDREDIIRWVEKYDGFFDSIRKSDNSEIL